MRPRQFDVGDLAWRREHVSPARRLLPKPAADLVPTCRRRRCRLSTPHPMWHRRTDCRLRLPNGSSARGRSGRVAGHDHGRPDFISDATLFGTRSAARATKAGSSSTPATSACFARSTSWPPTPHVRCMAARRLPPMSDRTTFERVMNHPNWPTQPVRHNRPPEQRHDSTP